MSYKYRFLNGEVPDKKEVVHKTPNPASKALVQKMEDAGVENFLDRFVQQTPQCRYGLTGTCCQRCLWGPCKVNKNKLRGICGADENLIIAGNLLRYLAAGCTSHGTHALQIAETIASFREIKWPYELKGEKRLKEMAHKLDIDDRERNTTELAKVIGKKLIETIKGGENETLAKIIKSYASPELVSLWGKLDIIPRSAMEEVFEALHLTTLGSCSDWKQLLKQELRTTLAYCYGTLLPACVGQEILFGIPEPNKTPVKVNYGILKKNTVNILISGHSPVLAERILSAVKSHEVKEKAKEAGAEKIVLAGACCTGNSLLSRHGVPTVANIMALELVLATGAVDALVLDMQCAIPGLAAVSDCFGGRIITTYGGNRFPNDYHVPFSPSLIEEADEKAMNICHLAIDSFSQRKGKSVFIPEVITEAVAGWHADSLFDTFDGIENFLKYLKEGKIKGLVSIGGCNSPKVPYEYNHVKLARELIKNGVLVLTSGCASYSLLNAGLASLDAAELASPELREICRKYGLPPVLPVGSCTDNFRLIQLYDRLAEGSKKKISEMPFCHSGPAPGSEKNMGQGLTFLIHGVSVHQGFPSGIPVPLPHQTENSKHTDDYKLEINDVANYFANEAYDTFGARVYVEPYPELAAKLIQMHLHRKRLGLKWKG